MQYGSHSTRVVNVAPSVETGNPNAKAEHNRGISLQVNSASKRSESPQTHDQIVRITTAIAEYLREL